MSAWSLITPADTDQATTIPEAIRQARVDIGERIVADNGTFEEHSFKTVSATGRHSLSNIGWAAEWSSLVDLTAAAEAGTIPAGSVHYIPGIGIYTIQDFKVHALSTLDHDALINLDSNDGTGGHSQYLRLDGSIPLTGDLYIYPRNASIAAEDDSPLHASHAYVGSFPSYTKRDWSIHGDAAVLGRHIKDNVVHSVPTYDYGGITIEENSNNAGIPYSYRVLTVTRDRVTGPIPLFPLSISLVNGSAATIQPGSSLTLKLTLFHLQVTAKTYYSGSQSGMTVDWREI